MAQAISKGIWGRTTTSEKSGGGVWQQVDNLLAEHPPAGEAARPSIWEIMVGQTPGGLWGQLGEETVVHDSAIAGIWSDALEETLILEGGTGGTGASHLWSELGDETIFMSDRSDVALWQEIGDETIILNVPEESIWEKASSSPGFIDMRPNRRLGYALKRFTTARGEVYFILKNLREGSYLRMNDRQLFLWHRMNGENTIQDIAVAYMAEYGSLDISILVDLLKKMEAGNFLTTQTTNVYDQLKAGLSRRGVLYWVKKVVEGFLKKEFPIRNIDVFYTRTYNGGIKYFYSKPAQLLFLIITLLGMPVFVYLMSTGTYSVIAGATSSATFGLISLYLARTIALFIHEGGHAYTCKHFGREVRKSGVMIYYGFFAFYVDTTDIWLEKRFPRIAVSFGGPYTGFILGGAASLVALFSPWAVLNGWMYQFAFLIIIDSIMNLNPLLKWDGYYILMDWLEMPNLRTRSLIFLKQGKLFKKIFQRQRFSREEFIFSAYGIGTFAYTGSLVLGFLIFFGQTIIDFIARIFNPIYLVPVILFLVLFLTRRKIMKIFGVFSGLRLARQPSKSK
jgi:putative peptide zinc metalloprotease protein